MRRVIDDVLNSIRGRGLENEDEIFAGLLDVADSLGDPSLYEKISLLRDPDVSNHTKIEVANAYYVAGDVANANRVLNEVENPKNEDEEEAFVANPSETVGMSSTELSIAFFSILIDRCKDITISIRCDSIHVIVLIDSFIV